ncbi:MAG: hypothetical protein WCJ40_21620 [Planctomycetota bacterium]|nr:hypothetical protein [Planctomycetota bacterium]
MHSQSPNPKAASSAPPKTGAQPVSIRNIYEHLGELRGLAQLVVYLADQIEDTDKRLDMATDPTQMAFLNRVLSMYTQELEIRHQGLSSQISSICKQVSTRARPSASRINRF